jgi:serine/threonine-protein kinase
VIDETIARARGRVGAVVNDKWRLDELLGAGGMACVYAATHRNGRRVAIKVLHPQMCAIPSVVTRFLREGYLANRVGHPGAVVVLDDDRTDDGAVFLVMELLEGHSLERYAKAGRPLLPRATVLRLMAETLDVLAAAHAKGIVHRDIKPANLFLGTDGHVKVLDFGIARLRETTGDSQTLTQSGSALGTPSFMPPEQARGRWEQVDARTDVWAVGATTYALLRGDRPRHAETTQEEMLLAMTQPLAPLASVVPDIAPEIAAVVDRAVAHERDQRWADAAAMRQAIAGLLGDPAILASGSTGAPSGSLPLAPQGAGATLVVPDSALTTGRPFASQPLASQPSRPRSSRGVAVAIAAVVTLGVLVTAGVLVLGRSSATRPRPPAAASPPAAVAPTATAATSTAPASATAPAATTPAASAAAPPAPSPSPAPSTSAAPARPVQRPAAGPRGPTPNPYDQRF